jgi:hypothetical protein
MTAPQERAVAFATAGRHLEKLGDRVIAAPDFSFMQRAQQGLVARTDGVPIGTSTVAGLGSARGASSGNAKPHGAGYYQNNHNAVRLRRDVPADWWMATSSINGSLHHAVPDGGIEAQVDRTMHDPRPARPFATVPAVEMALEDTGAVAPGEAPKVWNYQTATQPVLQQSRAGSFGGSLRAAAATITAGSGGAAQLAQAALGGSTTSSQVGSYSPHRRYYGRFCASIGTNEREAPYVPALEALVGKPWAEPRVDVELMKDPYLRKEGLHINHPGVFSHVAKRAAKATGVEFPPLEKSAVDFNFRYIPKHQ